MIPQSVYRVPLSHVYVTGLQVSVDDCPLFIQHYAEQNGQNL